MIYDRKTKKICEDSQYGGSYLHFLYDTPVGRILLRFIVLPVFSEINAGYNRTPLSRRKISGFVEDHGIDMSEYEDRDYRSFNDFFVRKKKHISFNRDEGIFIAPADSKLLYYKITDDLKIRIKQSVYTIDELLDGSADGGSFKNGNCLVFRLSVDDYHRYCYVDDGRMEKTRAIKGKLHTVSSISEKHKVYSRNTRVCSYMDTDHFGKIICIEVGALLVGKINNKNKRSFSKGEEKGYFELGGSTIIILTGDNVMIDDDIVSCSRKGIETKVRYGERIGEIRC